MTLLSLYLLSISFSFSIFSKIVFLLYLLSSLLNISPHSSHSSHHLQPHCFVHFSFIYTFHSPPLSFSSIFLPPLSSHFSTMSCTFNVVYLYSPSVCAYFCISFTTSIPYPATYFTLRLLPLTIILPVYSTSHFPFLSFPSLSFPLYFRPSTPISLVRSLYSSCLFSNSFLLFLRSFCCFFCFLLSFFPSFLTLTFHTIR